MWGSALRVHTDLQYNWFMAKGYVLCSRLFWIAIHKAAQAERTAIEYPMFRSSVTWSYTAKNLRTTASNIHGECPLQLGEERLGDIAESDKIHDKVIDTYFSCHRTLFTRIYLVFCVQLKKRWCVAFIISLFINLTSSAFWHRSIFKTLIFLHFLSFGI